MRPKTPSQLIDTVKELLAKQRPMERIWAYLSKAGHNLVYATLLMYHSYQRPETPAWSKRIIVGSIAYVLAPLDAIPDLTPFLGFTDDLGVLMLGLVSIAGHINAETKEASRAQMTTWFGITDFSVLHKVDEKI